MADDVDTTTAPPGADDAAPPPPNAGILTGDAAAPPAGDAPPADGAPAPEWLASITDEENRKWAEDKKFTDPNQVIERYRKLETLLGTEKVPVPKDAADKDGWERLFKAAGRPDTPDGYALDAIEGADPDMLKGFAAEAHKLGLNQAQVEGAVRYQMQLAAQQHEAVIERDRADGAALKREYGADFERVREEALNAGLAVGLNEQQMVTLRQQIGPKALIGMLHKIHKAIGEDSLERGAPVAGGKTAEQLEARKQEIMRTPDLRAKLQSGDPALKAEWAQINAAQAQLLARQNKAA